MPIRKRLLGLAFASSDLLLELDAAGVVTFALGAGPSTTERAEAFIGGPLATRISESDVQRLRETLAGLRPGARSPAVELAFAAGADRARRATVRFFVLPDLAPSVSCSISWEGPAYALRTEQARPALATGAFMDRAREVLSGPEAPRDLAVAFVNVEGLSASEAMGEAGARLNARIEAVLSAASLDGASAGKLGSERFALLRHASDKTDLAGEMREIGRSEGLELTVSCSEVALKPTDRPLNALRAMRFAVESCIRDGGLADPEATFSTSLSRTLKEAEAFRTMVRAREFDLHYQPIVDLKTGAVHHFEALARFGSASSPANTIRMAEELALIDAFDIAVAEKAISRMRRSGAGLLRFAINVSGASLADDHYVEALLRMTAAYPEDRRRVIVEVTESAALADVAAAGRRLSALREAGIKVCIDDFGSGSASYDYLRGLSVDTVKIDGKFVLGIESDPRARTLIGHLVELCGSLKVDTIAEMIETEGAATIMRDLGVDFGQGWHFGRAEPEPRTQSPAPKSVRRQGETVGWG